MWHRAVLVCAAWCVLVHSQTTPPPTPNFLSFDPADLSTIDYTKAKNLINLATNEGEAKTAAIDSQNLLNRKVVAIKVYLDGLNTNSAQLRKDASDVQKTALNDVPTFKDKFDRLDAKIKAGNGSLENQTKEFQDNVKMLFAAGRAKNLAAVAMMGTRVERGQTYLTNQGAAISTYPIARHFIQNYASNKGDLGMSADRADVDKRMTALETLGAALKERSHELSRRGGDSQKTSLTQIDALMANSSGLTDVQYRTQWQTVINNTPENMIKDLSDLSKMDTAIDRGRMLLSDPKNTFEMFENDFMKSEEFFKNFGSTKQDLLALGKNKVDAQRSVAAAEKFVQEIDLRKNELRPKLTLQQNRTLNKLVEYLPTLVEQRKKVNAIDTNDQVAVTTWSEVVTSLDSIGLNQIIELGTGINTDTQKLRNELREMGMSLNEPDKQLMLLTKYVNNPEAIKQLTSKNDIDKVLASYQGMVNATMPKELLEMKAKDPEMELPPPPPPPNQALVAKIDKMRADIKDGSASEASIQERFKALVTELSEEMKSRVNGMNLLQKAKNGAFQNLAAHIAIIVSVIVAMY